MRAAHYDRRAGYTLMEVLVVLAIIIIVGTISVPVIQTMMDDARITSSADQVRANLAETRARAMDSGKPWRLACIPNTGVFQLAPDDSADWENMEQYAIEKADLIRDSLAKDIVFGASAGDVRGSSTGGTPGSAWQTIAVYQYDGSAREDSTVYFGKAGTPPMAAELRGLTGSVTMRSATEVMAMQP